MSETCPTCGQLAPIRCEVYGCTAPAQYETYWRPDRDIIQLIRICEEHLSYPLLCRNLNRARPTTEGSGNP